MMTNAAVDMFFILLNTIRSKFYGPCGNMIFTVCRDAKLFSKMTTVFHPPTCGIRIRVFAHLPSASTVDVHSFPTSLVPCAIDLHIPKD